jgi:probable rRNA maturation factor
MVEIVGGPRGIGKSVLSRVLRLVAAEIGLTGGVTIKLADESAARDLNQRFRGRDYVPDVLSFPAGEPPPRVAYAGDILVCLPVAERQALAEGHSLRRELFVLMVHGLLHLGGHDHERDRGEMLALQRRLVERFGREF